MSMYLTVQEFKNAPTGIDTNGIIPGGTTAQNDAELHNIIMRASAWIDSICNQRLEATTNTETKEVTMNSRGLMKIHPNCAPIISMVDSVQYRLNPTGPWSPVPLTSIQISNRYFTIYQLNTTSVPVMGMQYPLSYRTPTRMHNLQRIPITVQYTYVNGYANSTVAVPCLAGATALTMANPVGVVPGKTLTIYDNELSEEVNVLSVAGSVVTLVSPLINGHAKGVAISELPATVKQAAILLASYLIKERGSLAIAMNETSLQGVSHYKDAADVDIATSLLYDLRRGLTS